MDRERLRLLSENIRSFLTGKRSRDALVFVFFVLISTGFWLLQTLNESYESDLQVRLELDSVPAGTVITTELPPTMQVRVRDKGSTLMEYYLSLKRRTVHIDFRTHDDGSTSGRVILTHSEIQKQLTDMLDNSTRIVTIRPDTLEYYYNRGYKRRVPVTFRGNVETAPLFYLYALHFVPDSVTVWGDEAYLDSLESVPTVPVNWDGLTENASREVQLISRRGVKVEPSEVTLVATVDLFTEKKVEVPVVGTNFPAGYALRTFPATATVTFRIGAMDFKNVDAEDFVLATTYEELISSGDSLIHLRLRSLPNGVSQVRIQPETVQYMIEQTED